MSHFVRSFILVTVGFVAGIVMTILLRREPAPRKPSAEATEQPRPIATQSLPQPAPANPPVATAPESPTSLDKAKRKGTTLAGQGLTDPARIHFGRPAKPAYDGILKAATWDDFYKQCGEQKAMGGEEYETLVFRRVVKDLGIDDESAASLKELLRVEQSATTKAIFDAAGGAVGFEKSLEDRASNMNALYDDWRRQRSIVRQTNNFEYLKLLTYDQLTFFNEHLRNSEVNFTASYSDEVHYFIGGVGKPVK
ncbi:MAG TPA: hypothetical protein VK661_11965 [Planctomycetota bacterium]|nr:hypothetical protein [Planctomycetota bacterium]